MGRGRSRSYSRSGSHANSADGTDRRTAAAASRGLRSGFGGSIFAALFGAPKSYSPEELVQKYPGTRVAQLRPEDVMHMPQDEIEEIMEENRHKDCEHFLQSVIKCIRFHAECIGNTSTMEGLDHAVYINLLYYHCRIEVFQDYYNSSSSVQP